MIYLGLAIVALSVWIAFWVGVRVGEARPLRDHLEALSRHASGMTRRLEGSTPTRQRY